MGENRLVDKSNGSYDVDHTQSFEDMAPGDEFMSLAEWLNSLFPQLSLSPDASQEELRACLIDGSVFCSILNKLSPGSVEMGVNLGPGSASVKRFLAAMDEMRLPRFELSDLEQGFMLPVMECLRTLKTQLCFSDEENGNQIYPRKRWDLPEGVATLEHSESVASKHHAGHKFHEVFQLKQGCNADLSDSKIVELMKSSSMDNASTQLLFSLLNRMLDESNERKNGNVSHQVACLLKKVLQAIERRISTQAENLKNQNNLFRAREEKYISRIRVLEALATGTMEENEILVKQLEQIKIEKRIIEDDKKLEVQDMHRLKEEKDHSAIEISRLRQELETSKMTHAKHCLQLESHAEETKIELEKKLKELEFLLIDSRKKVKELESFSESKSQRWKKKESTYRSFMDFQSVALKDLRVASEFIKHKVAETKKRYLEEFSYLGVKLKGLADAAENYHAVLAENRRLYNEVQDLKGNIRVYCRIRPFLPGQSKKRTTIDYIGENGELVVANPLKQGKDSHRLFKFNKVFGPMATQEEVFLDTQPLIRSVLDGYNVCIFAYGQTGSGKTYTMSGPSASAREAWGVNYRALNDLFQISQSRKNSTLYEVGVQMVEIYNEQVRDLLSGDGPQRRLGIWSTAQPNGLAVPEASMHSVKSTADVLELMNIGLMNRAVGATALNERSSRSHSILTVHVRGTDLETDAVLRGCLHLVDLAGSERVDRSEATGERLREAQHINKSLSALGDVIFALAQKSPHVPYRNSKLTQVLQSSLGGQAKALMFVQLNPDAESYSETISTLKFAERVSGVELGAAKSNKEGRDLKELMEQVTSLRETILKKDEEIHRLQLLKHNVNGVKHGMSSLRCGSLSPRRHSVGTPRQSQRISGAGGSGLSDRAASDVDKCSEYSDKHSEAGSHRSMDDLRNPKELISQSKLPLVDVDQNLMDDVELLGFGDADSEERLSDISDGGLSMGTETDGSNSLAEFTLFPGSVTAAEKTETTGRATIPSQLPKPPQKLVQAKSSRLSLARGSASKAPKSSRKTAASSSSAAKFLKRWQ